jgi:hypothetical protein
MLEERDADMTVKLFLMSTRRTTREGGIKDKLFLMSTRRTSRAGGIIDKRDADMIGASYEREELGGGRRERGMRSVIGKSNERRVYMSNADGEDEFGTLCDSTRHA